ncbi:MAG: phosphate ABC transporter substrate-binding protein [Tissierellia bacterium]|nr:phosphate ABC transporter substrate-binding protein [Tissierellia bacterium]
MKKLLTVVLSLVLVASLLAGCGTDNNSTGNNSSFNLNNEIVVVSREEGSGTRGAFVELTGVEAKDDNGNTVDRTYEEAIVYNGTNQVLTAVAGNEYAIGYISTGSLNNTVRPLKIDGVEPTTENIKNGSYKIARPFNIATKGDVSEITQDFIDFIMSKEGQEIVSDSFIAVDDNPSPYAGSKPSGKVIVAGSTSVTPVMEKLREAYLEINPNAEIEIHSTGSSAGMQAAITGTADIGMASRDLKDSEKAELDYLAIAIDGIAVINNPTNTIDDLALEQVTKIFTGEIIKWSDIK